MKAILSCCIFMLLSVSAAFAAPQLHFKQALPEEVQGSFSVILFDNPYGNGIQRIALLDREGDNLRIEPYAREDEYKVIKNLSGPDALKRAREFVMLPIETQSIQLTRITDERGTVIGYEVRPLYSSITYGTNDVLETSYRQKGDIIYVHVRLKDEIDRRVRGGGDRDR